jgi:hypothetical protein
MIQQTGSKGKVLVATVERLADGHWAVWQHCTRSSLIGMMQQAYVSTGGIQ